MHCCRIVNGTKKQKPKKQPWSNVECFAFGGATVRLAALETSFHAANHTIPPPPSYEVGASLKGCFFMFLFRCPQYFSTESITLPTAQYFHTPKRLTKTDSQTRTTTRNSHRKPASCGFFSKVHNIVDHNLVNFLFFHYLCSLIEKM